VLDTPSTVVNSEKSSKAAFGSIDSLDDAGESSEDQRQHDTIMLDACESSGDDQGDEGTQALREDVAMVFGHAETNLSPYGSEGQDHTTTSASGRSISRGRPK
jgi:hypothetical protein